MKVAYLVSRFPHVSETFIVRELDAVAADDRLDVELRSLYPPVNPTVHPIARPWVGRLRRPGAAQALAATAWWLVRRPVALLAVFAHVIRAYARRPASLVRAVATVPLAAAHARELRARAVERVHAHYATYPALAAWVCRRLAGIPYSFTAHAHDLYVDQSMLAEKVRDADFVVAISDFNRRYLEPYGGGRHTPVDVVHCGIDPRRYEFRHRDPGPRPRAVCVASLQEYKGHRYLLEALADPVLARVDLELVGDGKLRDELERLAAELGIAERVTFRGSLTEDEVAATLQRADIFVLPSVVARNGQMEGLPVALMEALAAGIPVVATRLSGIPEIIRDGETGVLAEPADAGSLTRALAAVVADPEAARRRAAAGRRLVEQEFDLGMTAGRIAGLLVDPTGQMSSPSVAGQGPAAPGR